MSPLSVADLIQLRNLGVKWYAEVELVSSSGVTQRTYFTDGESEILPGASSEKVLYGGVLSFDEIELGRAKLSEDGYKTDDVQLTLQNRQQYRTVGSDYLSTLRRYDLLGGVLRIFLALEASAEPADTDEVQIFEGIIDAVPSLYPLLVIQAKSNQDVDVPATATIDRTAYPSARLFDVGKVIPLLGGRTGFDPLWWSRDKDNLNAVHTVSWRRFAINLHGAPVPVINTTDYTLKASVAPISSTDLPSDSRILARWADNSGTRLPVVLHDVDPTTDYTESSAEIDIPKRLATDSTRSRDDDIGGLRFHVPTDVNDLTKTTWTDADAALDQHDLDSYAELINSLVVWRTEGNFMRDQWLRLITQVDPVTEATHNVKALIWTDRDNPPATSWVELVIAWTNGGGAVQSLSTGTTYNNLSKGWHLLNLTLTASALTGVMDVDLTIAGSQRYTWGDFADDGLTIAMKNSDQTLRVALIGLSVEYSVRPNPVTRSGPNDPALPTYTNWGQNFQPADFFFHGYALEKSGAAIYSPPDVLERILIDVGGLSASDLELGGSGEFGGFEEWEDELEAEVFGGLWNLSLVETRPDVTLQDVLDAISLQTYAHIWRSPKDHKWKARGKTFDATPSARRLTPDDLIWTAAGPMIEVSYTPESEILNSIRVDFGPDWSKSRGGTPRYTRYVLLTPDNVRNGRGGGDATRLAAADASRDRFGIHHKTISAPYLQDPVAAWEMLERRFDARVEPHVRLTFDTPLAWAWDMEITEVVGIATTDFDAILGGFPLPEGLITATLPSSWDNTKWWVERITLGRHSMRFSAVYNGELT